MGIGIIKLGVMVGLLFIVAYFAIGSFSSSDETDQLKERHI